jgi:uncharacterized protein YjbJ (UPF0337 family)
MAKGNTKDQGKGQAYEFKGKIKQKAGRALTIFELEEEGVEEEMAGNAQNKVGQIKKVFGS